MTAIAIGAVAAPVIPAAALSPVRTAAVPDPAAPRKEQPAVINDVASQAASRAEAISGDSLSNNLEGKINRVLEDIGSHNAFVSADRLVDWDMIEAKFGKTRVEEIKQTHDRFRGYRTSQVNQDVADLQGQASVTGLSLTRQKDGSFAVSDFSFTDAGSTYTIKRETDGRMVGLKDGQGWKTWQVEPPASSIGSGTGAATALAMLKAQPASAFGSVPTDLFA